MEDPEWKEWHKYTNPDNAYQNEIGEIGGVRFVESTEAKIFAKTGSAGTGSTKIDVYSTLIWAQMHMALRRLPAAVWKLS